MCWHSISLLISDIISHTERVSAKLSLYFILTQGVFWHNFFTYLWHNKRSWHKCLTLIWHIEGLDINVSLLIWHMEGLDINVSILIWQSSVLTLISLKISVTQEVTKINISLLISDTGVPNINVSLLSPHRMSVLHLWQKMLQYIFTYLWQRVYMCS